MRAPRSAIGPLLVLVSLGASCRPPPADGVGETAPHRSTAASPALGRALDEAAAGVDGAALRALLREHWAWVLQQDPVWASRLGVHDFDHQLADNSDAAEQQRRVFARELLARARALDGLSPRDEVTRRLFVEGLQADIASNVCDFHQWTLSPRSNPVTELSDLFEVVAIDTPEAGDRLVARYKDGARAIDDEIQNLRRGAARGLFATRESARRVAAMVKQTLEQPTSAWPMLKPAAVEHPDWEEPLLAAFRRRLFDVVEHLVRPALARYHAFIETEVLPHARPDEASGLGALPEIGPACYAARIRAHTTTELGAETIHELGLREIARTDTELATLGAVAFGATSLEDTLTKLRSDPTLYFESEAEVVAAAEATLAAAKTKLTDTFGILPKADCVVRRVPDHEAPYTTIAYYRPAHPDGSKPGEYFVNVFEPQKRPRFEARVLAVHESIPGHHLQIAIAQEQPALPAFRKHGGYTAYVEGWALYTERLADTMGLYHDDLDRIGVASFDAWRSGRLVVDTGIHHFGWSRQRAKDFLAQHTALSPENIDNEVDRYIVWPGQALAYKLGQLAIDRLRARAEATLGERFALPAFHDAVLSLGPVTLAVLDAEVERRLAASR